jgi:hypothetical protein
VIWCVVVVIVVIVVVIVVGVGVGFDRIFIIAVDGVVLMMFCCRGCQVESLAAAEKVIKGKDVLEGHMKSAVQEANIEISRNTESIVAKDKLLNDNAEYIEILEKRLERNKQATEKIVGELKCSILEQDETIHSLEEKCLSQANESAKEIDAFRTENFSISIKLQVV